MKKGERAIFCIEHLRHSKGEWYGKPIKLEQWQKDFILKLLDTQNDEGLRQYRQALLFIPRKNGKSILVAALAIYFLLFDAEKGGEIYSAASSRDQASLVFNMALSMLRQDKHLLNRVRIVESQKLIINKATGTFYKALSADAHNKHGYNASVVLYDEVHTAPNRQLWDVLATSMAARREPLMIGVTTAGNDKLSFCHELYTYAKRVAADPALDRTFLPVIYEAAEGDSFDAEATWKKANPNYGVSVKPAYFEQAAAKAAILPTELNRFLQLHLNVWVSANSKFIPMDHWHQCGEVPVDLAELAGRDCFAGLDLASTSDIAALCLAFPQPEGWVVLPRFYLPEDTAWKRAKIDSIPYLEWANQGLITLTPGNVLDYDQIRNDIGELQEQYNIREIAIDRWNATQITTQLTGDGFTVVPFGQGFASMSAPCKEIERLVLSKKLLHLNNPILTWMAGNVIVKTDAAGNIKFDKGKSLEKIDGMVAIAMALGRGMASDSTPLDTSFELAI